MEARSRENGFGDSGTVIAAFDGSTGVAYSIAGGTRPGLRQGDGKDGRLGRRRTVWDHWPVGALMAGLIARPRPPQAVALARARVLARGGTVIVTFNGSAGAVIRSSAE
jgi:hypothetical protein